VFAKSRPSTRRAGSVLAALSLVVSLLAWPQGARAEKLTLLLDWFLNPDHAPLVVALQKGYFREAGLEVVLIEPADPNDPPKLVAAGKAEVAVTYQPQLHIQAAAGLPGFEDALLKAMLERVGLSLDDITLINVNFSLSPALLSGQVDAVIGAYRNFELNQLAIEGYKGRAFYLEEEGIPPKLDDPRLAKLVAAVERAVQFLINHPEDAWALFVAYRPELEDELNRRAWRDTLPRFALRPAALDRGRYERFARFLEAQGVIATPPPSESYAVTLR
jgi:putative hydroxymethylpyrimidine transport system substrate-binding protein